MKNILFEHVSILDRKLSEEEFKETLDQYRQYFQEHKLEIDNFEDIGLKKLAYPVKGDEEGHYIIYRFWADRNDISDFEKFTRENDNVIKFITIKTDQVRDIDENSNDNENEEDEEL